MYGRVAKKDKKLRKTYLALDDWAQQAKVFTVIKIVVLFSITVFWVFGGSRMLVFIR